MGQTGTPRTGSFVVSAYFPLFLCKSMQMNNHSQNAKRGCQEMSVAFWVNLNDRVLWVNVLCEIMHCGYFLHYGNYCILGIIIVGNFALKIWKEIF
jgi:hypothetical protein